MLQALEEVYRQTQARALQRIEAARKQPQEMLKLLLADSKEFFLGEDFLLSLDLTMVDPESSLGVSVSNWPSRTGCEWSRLGSTHWQRQARRTQASAVVRSTFAIPRGFGIRRLIAASEQDVDHCWGLGSNWRRLCSCLATRRSGKRRLASAEPRRHTQKEVGARLTRW